MSECPNCGESQVRVHKKEWFITRYVCVNPRCMKKDQIFSVDTWFSWGVAGTKVVTFALLGSLLGGNGTGGGGTSSA
jgi:hypothetical protein